MARFVAFDVGSERVKQIAKYGIICEEKGGGHE